MNNLFSFTTYVFESDVVPGVTDKEIMKPCTIDLDKVESCYEEFNGNLRIVMDSGDYYEAFDITIEQFQYIWKKK